MSLRDMTWGRCHEGWCRHKAGSRRHIGAPKRISDPVWCISRIQSDIYISWIQSDASGLGSDPTFNTLFTFLFNYLSTHAHTAEGEAFNDHQMLKSCSCISLLGSTLVGSTLGGSTLVGSIPPSSSGCWGRLWGEYSTEFLSANIPRNSLVNAFFALLRRQMHDRAARWWLHHVRIVIVLHGVVTILLLRIYWVPMSTD